MAYSKKKLIDIAAKIESNAKLTPSEMEYVCSFERKSNTNTAMKMLQNFALPASLAFGFLFTVFPSYFQGLIKHMPSWTNFSPPILTGVDYLWDLIGEPVHRANIIYHIPNIVLYSFGIFGVKKLFDTLDKRTWLDRVLAAKSTLADNIKNGTIYTSLKKGHSVLFVGNGDFIGMQFVHNHKPDMAITVSQSKPSYSMVWNYYDQNTTFEDLKDVLIRSGSETAGEYIFFPVKDDQIFLPDLHEYDLSPHKLDILCQNIRKIEKENKWKTKRIIIVGDRYHKSFVQSEDKNGILKNTEDIISLESISKKYQKVTLIDPTDVVLKKIMQIAKGRKIVFRATREGISEYKQRFYERLEKLGYKHQSTKAGNLTIGHDLSEDLTEQQTLTRKIDDYYPVVLSKNVRDALIRNGYNDYEFLYVPTLVLETLTESADRQ